MEKSAGDTWNMSHRWIFFFSSSKPFFFLTLQILANVIIFTCGNLAGAYHKHLMDLALRQTYQDTCNCIKSPIKLEFEKYQQVQEKKKGQQTVFPHFLSQHVFAIFKGFAGFASGRVAAFFIALAPCQIEGLPNPSELSHHESIW